MQSYIYINMRNLPVTGLSVCICNQHNEISKHKLRKLIEHRKWVLNMQAAGEKSEMCALFVCFVWMFVLVKISLVYFGCVEVLNRLP